MYPALKTPLSNNRQLLYDKVVKFSGGIQRVKEQLVVRWLILSWLNISTSLIMTIYDFTDLHVRKMKLNIFVLATP